jgi:hypothetical protein
MDRFTWLLAGGVAALCIVALALVALARATQPAPDASSPEGVVSAYLLALQNRDPDRAWDLLASPQALVTPFPTPRSEQPTREAFRQQVLNQPRSSDRRVRVVGTTQSDNTARVEVEIIYGASGPFTFGSPRPGQTRVFELVQRNGAWAITASPPVFDLV